MSMNAHTDTHKNWHTSTDTYALMDKTEKEYYALTWFSISAFSKATSKVPEGLLALDLWPPPEPPKGQEESSWDGKQSGIPHFRDGPENHNWTTK